jgi:hypothetical protein
VWGIPVVREGLPNRRDLVIIARCAYMTDWNPVGPTPKYPLADVLPLVGACEFSKANSTRWVMAEFDCSEVKSQEYMRARLRELKPAHFLKRERYQDGKVADQYKMPRDPGLKPWFIKLRVTESGRLRVDSFHPDQL